MLQFIADTSPKCPGDVDLKTSHVTVYQFSAYLDTSKYGHLKTSHVTVYQNTIYRALIRKANLKTSHVTVYHCWKSVTALV